MRRWLDLLSAIVLAATPIRAAGQLSPPEILPSNALHTQIKMDPRFVPRDRFPRPKPIVRPTAKTRPLPRAKGGDDDFEKDGSDGFLQNWEKRWSVDTYRKLHASAMKLRARSGKPLAPTVPQPLVSTSSWSQIGAGIVQDSVHNYAGRMRQSWYAYDNQQGATVLWLGATGGGVWKSVFLGFAVAWVPVSDNIPGSPSVGAFLVDPTNSSQILVGSGDYVRYAGDGIYKTTDGGTTWNNQGPYPQVSAFQKILDDLSDTSGNTVLASGWDGSSNSGIWRSADFGSTWFQYYDGPATDLVQDPMYTNNWYAGESNYGVIFSDNGGATWTNLGYNPFGSDCRRVSITVCAAAPNFVYALVENGSDHLNNIYRSVDYGAHWTAIDTMDSMSPNGQGRHTCAVTVDPTNPDRLFCGMSQMQWTSNATYPSVTWNRYVDGGHPDYTSFLFEPNSTNVVITCDGGYFNYNYATNTVSGIGNTFGLNCEQCMTPFSWTQDISLPLASAYTDPLRLLTGLQDNGIARIDESTTPTINELSLSDGAQVSISPDNPSEFGFEEYGATRLFSPNNGTTIGNIDMGLSGNDWPNVLIDPTPLLTSPAMYTYSGSYLFAAIPGLTSVWSSVNAIPLPSNFEIKQVDKANDPSNLTFYITGDSSGKLYVMDQSVDGSIGSMNYEDRTPPLGTVVGQAAFDCMVYADRSSLQPQTVYYTTGASRPSQAFISTNRGVSWTEVTGDITATLYYANLNRLVGNPANLNQLWIATNVGIYYSNNGGKNWNAWMDGLPAVADVCGVDVNYDNSSPAAIRIGTYGRGYWERDFTTDPPTVPIMGQIMLEGNVNPSGTVIQLNFRPSSGVEPVTRTVTLGRSTGGGSTATFEVDDMPQGSYTVAFKGLKWLQSDVPVDTTSGSVSNVNVTLLAGDIDNNNVVDINDFSLLADAFGSDPSQPIWNPNADLNNDGVVDITDFSLLAGNFGQGGDP